MEETKQSEPLTQLSLKVSEIFFSLQGEGARAGEASVFIRLQGCSAKHACAHSGVVCDTEFESGQETALDDLLVKLWATVGYAPTHEMGVPWIVFTGGEPLDQLTAEHLMWFKQLGHKIAIETSGVKPLSQQMADCIDWIVVSPKVAEHILVKNFGHLECEVLGADENNVLGVLLYNVHELRYVRHAGQPAVPEPSLKALHYYLSPHSDGAEINSANLKHCIKLCLENIKWRLSTQQHKLWEVL